MEVWIWGCGVGWIHGSVANCTWEVTAQDFGSLLTVSGVGIWVLEFSIYRLGLPVLGVERKCHHSCWSVKDWSALSYSTFLLVWQHDGKN